ncbi:MAG: peptidase M20 [Dethiosulfovibrio peptidovorans]|nr:MAG: peptidase M20 [Dethiosulfovibrio peptidovorans]
MDTLREQIDAMKDDLVAAIRENVAIKSVEGEPEPGAPFGSGPKAAMDNFVAIAERLGFRTGVFENMVAWAELGDPQAELVTILGHVDVVPEGDGWSCDPYKGKIEDGMLYGRGVMDDKGPIVGALFALKAIADLKIPLKRRIRVMVGTNEETGSKAVARYVEAGQDLPVAGFTPDAEYPLINGEKGSATVELSAPFAAVGPIQVLSFDGGVAFNSVPARAVAHVMVEPGMEERLLFTASFWKGPQGTSLTVEDCGDRRFCLCMTGVPAHGSLPQKGVNAVAWLVKVLRLLGVSGEQGKTLALLDRLVGTECYGESLGVCRYDDVSRYTSVCWGTMKSDGDAVRFSLNVRFPVSFKLEEVLPDLQRAFDDEDLQVLSIHTHPPLYMPEDSELVAKLMDVYRRETGRTDDRPMSIGGGTYAKAMPNVLAFGPTMPGEPSNIHEANECWAVDNIITSTKIVAAAMVSLAGGL